LNELANVLNGVSILVSNYYRAILALFIIKLLKLGNKMIKGWSKEKMEDRVGQGAVWVVLMGIDVL
jgi:hypothetical protein